MRTNSCCQEREKSYKGIIGFGLLGLLLSVLGFLAFSNYKNASKEPEFEEQNILYLPLN